MSGKNIFVAFISAVFILISTVTASTFNSNTYYYVSCGSNNSNCMVKEGKGEGKSHAYAMYNDEVHKDGWGKLWIHSDQTVQGTYEAGILEGALTSERIYQHYKSWYSYQFPATAPLQDSTVQFLEDQYNYAWDLVHANPNDIYYQRLQHFLTQYEGIVYGMQHYATPGMNLTKTEILTLEAAGDLYDIIPATVPKEKGFKLHIGKLSKDEFEAEWHRMVSCSAMIKVGNNFSDVFVGHTTWTSYVNMLRIYKNYYLLNGDYQVSFSAKPGVIYSKDDFYTLPRKEQQMTVLETTNGILNAELYKLINVKTLLTWQRIPLTNSLATSGEEWVTIFGQHNSGTYCNQYMIVDMKKFTPNQRPQPGFVWITEVIPGATPSEDVTDIILSLGNVWPSFNIPYFKSVYILSGYQQAYYTYGDSYSYENCSRALMMKRDHVKIQSLEDMGNYMRYDDYQNDIYSAGNPGTAISPRYDLRTEKGSAFGGIDAKVTSYYSLMKGVVMAQSGPTHATSDLPAFQWSTCNYTNNLVHLGQPDTFNFGFVEMNFYQH